MTMKHRTLLVLIIGLATSALAQTTVSGTVTDTDSQPWASGTWQVSFYPTANVPGLPPGTQSVFSGTLDSSGAYSVAIPAGTWIFTLTPRSTLSTQGQLAVTGGQYVSAPIVVTGSTQTQNFTPPPPRFPYQLNSFGYTAAELTTSPALPGSAFYLTSSSGGQVIWNGSAWGAPSPGGTAGGDLTGTYPNPTVKSLTGSTSYTVGTYTTLASTYVQSLNYQANVSTLSGATPNINSQFTYATITLSANATPTISNISLGTSLTLQICQPGTGGPYTWTWPAAMHGGMTIGTTAGDCSQQTFVSFNGSTFVATGPGITNVAP